MEVVIRHSVCRGESVCFFFFKQKTSYEMRISDWSSDVCSSDPAAPRLRAGAAEPRSALRRAVLHRGDQYAHLLPAGVPGASTEIGRASCRERGCQFV